MVAHEEEATVVVDVGSASVKAGFSGEDTPRSVFPSLAEDLDFTAEEILTYRARRPEVSPGGGCDVRWLCPLGYVFLSGQYSRRTCHAAYAWVRTRVQLVQPREVSTPSTLGRTCIVCRKSSAR